MIQAVSDSINTAVQPRYLSPVYAFILVELLLLSEEVLSELLLKALVGIVDTQLLKTAGNKQRRQQAASV